MPDNGVMATPPSGQMPMLGMPPLEMSPQQPPQAPQVAPPPMQATESQGNVNLLLLLTASDQQKLAEEVIETTEEDLKGRTDWEERAATSMKLFFGISDPKTFPWESCSNLPPSDVTVACYQFQSRAYEALISKDIVKCIPTDGKAVGAAKRAQTYMNWQITFKMKDWIPQMDRGLLMLAIVGCIVKKTTFDLVRKIPVSKLLGIGDFVAPYGVMSLDDAKRKTHIYRQSLDDIRKIEASGGYTNTDKVLTPASSTEDHAPEIKAVSDKATGQTESSLDIDKDRVIYEQHTYYDLNGDGIGEPVIVFVDKEARTALRMETRTYSNPITRKDEVVEHFTSYPLFPNPESWMGIGFGHILRPYAEAIKAITDQIIDSGTLANLSGKTGFIQKQYGGRKGIIELMLGEFTEVEVPVDDLKKGIFPLQFSEPSTMLFQLLGRLDTKVDRLASLSESMMGELPPSDTAATTMMAIMEQGLKVFSSVLQRLHRSLGEELNKIFYLNSIYLDDTEYAMVQDSTSEEWTPFQSGKIDFMNNIDVIAASDPTLASRAERLARAKEVYSVIMGSPLAQGNPVAVYEATKDYLDALEVKNQGRFKFEEIMKAMVAAMTAQLQQGGMNGAQPGRPQGMVQPGGNAAVPQGTGRPQGANA